MSIFEYDKEEEERKLREAEYEARKETGHREIIDLMNKLMESGRMEDMKRVIENEEYRA